MATKLIPEEMSELFKYDPETGDIWRKAGNIAPHTSGYKTLKFRQRKFFAHRVAWFLMTGEQPPVEMTVDHIDGNKTNNAWTNLRLLTPQQNCWNRVKKLRGIWFNRKNKNWVARIKAKGEEIALYHGPDFFEACCRRKSAENRLHEYTPMTS